MTKCPGTNVRGEQCGHDAGWGVEGADVGAEDAGPCKIHRDDDNYPNGNTQLEGKTFEVHQGNQHAQTHGLFSEMDKYYEALDSDEQEWIFDFTNVLLDRYRRFHSKDPDMFDKEALKNIAIDFHRVAHANGWFKEHGMTHVEQIRSDSYTKTEQKVNVWASEIRKYNESIYKRMQKHGLLDDPESAKADSMGDMKAAWIEDLTE